MTDDANKPALDSSSADAPESSEERADGEKPSEELRKALDHLGRAATSFRDRYLSDDKIHEVAEKARVNAEHLAEDAEKALRKAGGALDVVAVDAEQSVTRVAHEAEKTLREAQKAAAPAIKAGIARLTALLEGKPEHHGEGDSTAPHDGAPDAPSASADDEKPAS